MTKHSRRCDLEGKVALVTGGSKGIGQHMALELAAVGPKVAIASRHPDEGSGVAEAIRDAGGTATTLYVDISKVETIAPMVQEICSTWGKIDILVNNAGVNIRKAAIEFGEEEWDRILDTNLKGTFFCSQAVARAMLSSGGGKIINISSLSGQRAVPWLGPYSISKGGIIQLTRALALEWAQYKITVNAIAPSYVETPLTREWLSEPERYRLIADRSPMKRIGKPEDLTGALLLFASEQAGFITGQTLFVDGGSSAGWAVDWES